MPSILHITSNLSKYVSAWVFCKYNQCLCRVPASIYGVVCFCLGLGYWWVDRNLFLGPWLVERGTSLRVLWEWRFSENPCRLSIFFMTSLTYSSLMCRCAQFLSCGATSIYSLLCLSDVCPTFLGLWLVENIIVIEVEVGEPHKDKILSSSSTSMTISAEAGKQENNESLSWTVPHSDLNPNYNQEESKILAWVSTLQ